MHGSYLHTTTIRIKNSLPKTFWTNQGQITYTRLENLFVQQQTGKTNRIGTLRVSRSSTI